MKQIVKKIARRILRNEIHEAEKRQDALANEIKSLRENYFGKQEVLLGKSIIAGIINLLPDPNQAVREPMKAFMKEGTALCTSVDGRFRLVVREFIIGHHVTIEIEPLKMLVNIPHREDTFHASIMGMCIDVKSYVYDLYQAGIREIDDENFYRIIEFGVSAVNVAKETGLLNYTK